MRTWLSQVQKDQTNESLSIGSTGNTWYYVLRSLAVYSFPFNNDSNTFFSCQVGMPARSFFSFYQALFYHSFAYASDLLSAPCCHCYAKSVWSWWNYRGRDRNLTGSHRHAFSPPSSWVGYLEDKNKKALLSGWFPEKVSSEFNSQ